MKNKVIKSVSFFLAVISCFFGFYSLKWDAYATDELPDYRLAISPSKGEVGAMKPGMTYSGFFKILNQGKRDFDYSIATAPYTVQNENYDPSFSIENQYTEMSNWIKTDIEEGSLASGEEKTVNFTITIPEDAHGGGQSASILVTMKNNSDVESGVEAIRQLGYLVFGNVDGEVTKTGKVLENKVPSFLFNPPIIGTSVVENTGNVYTAAKYSLQVFPLFSDEEIYTNEETPDNNIVFPETKRFNQVEWEGAPHLGIFRVRQTVEIFDDKSVTEKLVFLCPLWFLFIVILLIFCVIFWIISRVIKRKKEA